MTAPAVSVLTIEHLDFQPTCDARDGKKACEAPSDFSVTVHGHVLAYKNGTQVKEGDMTCHFCSDHLAAFNEFARKRLPSRCRGCTRVFTRLSDIILHVVAL
ncbi:hypothetical protein [Rhodococcus sp. SORGH_AS_0303]|uniref:hypothetical protein n=1 Tax=Rhodococcus sp. SORGH_AS_0303 TaxID=3041753 RepID=UPI00278A53BC|nr:hypothetical protein [Rhodococcus sp. SORGH_AS_0303]MDQ1202828.1 hypothetical protein [Rhodococcus sp. SORGH_AS_0303]